MGLIENWYGPRFYSSAWLSMNFSVKTVILLVASVLIFICTTDAQAGRSRKDYFLNPQVGIWFGPVAPLGSTRDVVDTALGGGAFFRYNFPFKALKSFKIGIDSSYQHFDSKGVNELYMVPLYGNFLYLLPFNLPVKMQLKAGFGESYVYAKPDKIGQWDPTFNTGFEVSFPAGRIINIGLRLDYLYVYEGYVEKSKCGGHIFNAGVTLYFNLNLD